MKESAKTRSGFTIFMMLQSLRLHFRSNGHYNALTYNFKTSVKKETFLQNKFRWSFSKLETEQSDIDILLRMIIVIDTFKYKSFTDKAFFNRLHSPKNSIESFYSTLEEDLNFIKQTYGTLDEAIDAQNGLYPSLYDEQLRGNISFLTLMVIDAFATDNFNGILKKERSKDVLNWVQVIELGNLVKPLLVVALNEDKVYDTLNQYF